MFGEPQPKEEKLRIPESNSSRNSSANNSAHSREVPAEPSRGHARADVESPLARKEFHSGRTKKFGYNRLKSRTGREKKGPRPKQKKQSPSPSAEPKSVLSELVGDTIDFKNPQQLIQKFSDLEERNLFLIEKNQDNEQAYFELKKKFSETKEEKALQIRELESKKQFLKNRIKGGLTRQKRAPPGKSAAKGATAAEEFSGAGNAGGAGDSEVVPELGAQESPQNRQ